MKQLVITIVLGVAALALGAGLLGCCPKENSAKTAACKTSKSADDCKTCCGGNYSYTGEGSCSCF